MGGAGRGTSESNGEIVSDLCGKIYSYVKNEAKVVAKTNVITFTMDYKKNVQWVVSDRSICSDKKDTIENYGDVVSSFTSIFCTDNFLVKVYFNH